MDPNSLSLFAAAGITLTETKLRICWMFSENSLTQSVVRFSLTFCVSRVVSPSHVANSSSLFHSRQEFMGADSGAIRRSSSQNPAVGCYHFLREYPLFTSGPVHTRCEPSSHVQGCAKEWVPKSSVWMSIDANICLDSLKNSFRICLEILSCVNGAFQQVQTSTNSTSWA